MSKLDNKKNILFVGSFKTKAKDGSVGGQMFACSTLINSSIKDKVNWVLLDVTAPTNMKRGIIKRAFSAFPRLINFFFKLVFKKIDLVIIFSANGTSFLEKGTMAIIANKFNKSIIFAPRAGALMKELSTNKKMASFARKVFKASSTIICQSLVWKTFFDQFTDHSKKLIVVENWIDVNKYHLEDNQDFDIPTFLFLSWVTKEKGVFELIEAVKKLNEENIKFQVFICGGGSDLIEAQEKVTENNISNIFFKGWVTGQAKLALLNKSHFYLLPSYTEGFSNSLLEAMASGLAVITTPVGASVDLIKDKKNGLLIDIKSSDAIINAMRFYLKNPDLRKLIGQTAKENVRMNNSIDSAVRSFSEVIDKI